MATFHENLVQSFHNFRDKYLKANGNFFKFSYDTTTQKYGFTINGTFHPFKTVQASKTVTAGTSAKTVTPDSGYDGIASVTVNPTPSQTKSVTAGTSDKTVSPDSGKLLSKVTVNPTPSQTKSASPSTSAQTISPDSGKLLSSVSISAISPQRVPTTPNQATLTGYNDTGAYVWFPEGWWPAQDNTHGSYVYMTQAQAQQAHSHTGTRASVTSNGTIDLGATHNIRYVPVSVSVLNTLYATNLGIVNYNAKTFNVSVGDIIVGTNILSSYTHTNLTLLVNTNYEGNQVCIYRATSTSITVSGNSAGSNYFRIYRG